jgi:hypothetical protein
MRTIHKITAATLSSAVLFGLSGLTAAAIAAEPAPGTIAEQPGVDVRAAGSVPDRQEMAATAYHRRFTITNLSSHRSRSPGPTPASSTFSPAACGSTGTPINCRRSAFCPRRARSLPGGLGIRNGQQR